MGDMKCISWKKINSATINESQVTPKRKEAKIKIRASSGSWHKIK